MDKSGDEGQLGLAPGSPLHPPASPPACLSSLPVQARQSLERILETVTIPTLPGVVARVGALLDDPEVGLPEVAEVVTNDASIAAKALRMANSAWYGLREEVVSIQQAAVVLGGTVLKNIVLQASVISRYEHLKSQRGFDPHHVWRHAVLTGQVCQHLAMVCKRNLGLEPDELYTCGLLHDIGKLLLLESYGEQYLGLIHEAREQDYLLHQLEEAQLGFHHGHVGAMVAARWKLPKPVLCAIRFHHGPPDRVHKSAVVLLVTCADRIANRAARRGDTNPRELLNLATRKRLGLDREALAEVLDQARTNWRTIQV